jgi:alpha-galactosidase
VLDKFYAQNAQDDPEASFRSIGEPFGWSFYKENGAFPAPGDRHVTEFLTEFFPGGSYYGKTLGIDAYSFEGVIKCGDIIHNQMMEAANSPYPLPDEYFRHIQGEHALLMDIIDAIECDSRRMFSVNLPNNGAVKNLPYDAVL